MKHVLVKKGEKLLVLLHGTGGDENDLLALGGEVAPGYSLLGVRGTVLEHGMNRWFSRHGMNQFDEDEIRRKAAELYEFLLEIADNFEEVALLGYSNGANMGAALLLLHQFPSRCVFMHPLLPVHGVVADLSSTRALVTAGEQDRMIPIAMAKELSNALAELGCAVEFFSHGEGHNITAGEVEAARNFLS